jgi:hypothetical protein
MNNNNKFYITELGQSVWLSPSLYTQGTKLYYETCSKNTRGLLAVNGGPWTSNESELTCE